ncbi:MAG: hypothetical protein M3248_04090 [Actinomycetota bacterium]|nr:hypothetical protein [Actinomycetota bacterium]
MELPVSREEGNLAQDLELLILLTVDVQWRRQLLDRPIGSSRLLAGNLDRD